MTIPSPQLFHLEVCDQRQRYKPLYEELCRLGAPPIVLGRLDKKPAFGSVPQSLVGNASEACEALRNGYNLGRVAYLESLRSHNPYGIEVLDLDSSDHGLDLTPFTGLMTRRAGERDRCHLWFRRPSPHLPRKGARKGSKALPDGAYDLMPWNSVLPGSVHPNGSTYELYVWRDGGWVIWDSREPLNLLERLPLVDPEHYRPQRTGGMFDLVSGQLNEHPFLTHPGKLSDREYAARFYVRGLLRSGVVSHAGKGGRATLAKVASHLMGYLQLPLETAFRYLTQPLYDWGWGRGRECGIETCPDDQRARRWNQKSWNACCTDSKTGAPAPWSAGDLIEALEWGARSVPIYGVIRWEQEAQREHVKACLRHFIAFLASLVCPSRSEVNMSARTLYGAFLRLYGLEADECSTRRFGVAMTDAINREELQLYKLTRTAAHTIHYGGFSNTDLEARFADWSMIHPLPALPGCVKPTTPISGVA